MASTLRERLLRHWPIKLTALVLAAVLWAVVAAEEPTTEIIPVELRVELPPGRALARPLPRVQALYSGSARELFKLYGQPPIIHKTIPDTVGGSSVRLDLSPSDLRTAEDADVTAVEVQPRVISIGLDDAVERMVPVVSRIRVSADSGFVITGTPRLIPDSVTVRGPAVRVSRVRSVATETMTLNELRDPIRTTIAVDTRNLGVVQVTPSELDVLVDVAQLTERLIMGVPVEIQADRPGAWITEPTIVVVTVRGLTNRLASLTRDSVVATALISGVIGEEQSVVRVTAPAGLDAWATPDTVTVRRRGG